jgi:hypothetical protein
MWYLMISIFGAKLEYCMLILPENHFYITELFVCVFAITDIRHEDYCIETAYTYNIIHLISTVLCATIHQLNSLKL